MLGFWDGEANNLGPSELLSKVSQNWKASRMTVRNGSLTPTFTTYKYYQFFVVAALFVGVIRMMKHHGKNESKQGRKESVSVCWKVSLMSAESCVYVVSIAAKSRHSLIKYFN